MTSTHSRRGLASLIEFPLLFLFGLAAGCGGAPRGGHGGGHDDGHRAPPPSEGAAAFAASSNTFGLDVWRQLAEPGTRNLAISPASISTALAMTYGGARGTTATAMASGLHVSTGPEETMSAAGSLVRAWNDPSRTSYELAVANRLFGERGYVFQPAFLSATRDAFGAELERVDFVTASEPARVGINGWVSDMTHARIPEILPAGSVDDDTRLVLVNAVYFHGQWVVPFDPEATFDASFQTGSASTVNVPTMHRTGGRYGEDAGVQLYELPYAGDEVSMLFVLPRDRNGLPAIEASLDADDVARWAGLVHGTEDVEVALPRFRIETDPFSLRPALMRLGMSEIFEPHADFSGMSAPGEDPLFVSDVFHRVFVELNEEGTEAAAATAVVMTTESAAMVDPPRFLADHPFLFFLRDQRTGAILFAGRVADPS